MPSSTRRRGNLFSGQYLFSLKSEKGQFQLIHKGFLKTLTTVTCIPKYQFNLKYFIFLEVAPKFKLNFISVTEMSTTAHARPGNYEGLTANKTFGRASEEAKQKFSLEKLLLPHNF